MKDKTWIKVLSLFLYHNLDNFKTKDNINFQKICVGVDRSIFVELVL